MSRTMVDFWTENVISSASAAGSWAEINNHCTENI